MAVQNFLCSIMTVDELTAMNLNRTMTTYSVTISNPNSSNQSLWTIALIKDDDTYVLNPTAGTYTGIVAIQVNGTAYQTP